MANARNNQANAETERYRRHLALPEVGEAGQRRLQGARALIVGLGGLGSPAALYLAAAGVGVLGLVDGDRVEAGNLQRQIIHDTPRLGAEKTASARERLAALNPESAVEIHPGRLTADNAPDLVRRYDLVLGCLDNLAARYVLNAACVRQGKPNVHGAAEGFEGQAAVFSHRGGPCYRCLFRDPPPEDRQAAAGVGVLSPVPGVIGCIMATEALKILLDAGETLSGRLLLYDALAMRFREIPVRRDPDCPVCGGISPSPAP